MRGMAVAVVNAVIHERTKIGPRNPLPEASNCEVVEWTTLLRGPLYHPVAPSCADVNLQKMRDFSTLIF